MSLYHYTSSTAAAAILQDGRFRASNVSFSNDRLEFSFGLEYMMRRSHSREPKPTDSPDAQTEWESVVNALKEFESTLNAGHAPYYIICLNTIKPDSTNSLNSWLAYAGESGVCLEMDLPERTMYFAVDKDDKLHKLNCRLRTVGYIDSPEPTEAPVDGDSKSLDSTINWDDPDNVIILKKADFKQEHEQRWAIHEGVVSGFLKYRDAGGFTIPYVEITTAPSPRSKLIGWPIRAVTIGPGRNQQQVFNSFRSLLNRPPNNENPIHVRTIGRRDYAKAWKDCCQQWQELAETEIARLMQTHFMVSPTSRIRPEDDDPFRYTRIARLKELVNELTAFATQIRPDTAIPASYDLHLTSLMQVVARYPELKEYLAQHYPTRTGIVLHRSLSPYRHR